MSDNEDNGEKYNRRKSDHPDERVFFIKRATWLLMKRMALRSVVMAFLTIAGAAVLQHLVESGRFDKFGLVAQFPEMLSLMRAVIIITFAEMSLFWIRLSTSPQLDVQEYAKVAAKEPMAAAIVYVTNTAQWAIRFGIFLYLSQGS